MMGALALGIVFKAFDIYESRSSDEENAPVEAESAAQPPDSPASKSADKSAAESAEKSALKINPKAIFVSEVLMMIVLGGLLLVLHWWSGATLGDYGLDFSKAGYDIRLGLMAFVAVSVPTYGLQYVLSIFVMEASHPVTNAMTKDPSVSLVAAMIGLAVVLAPVLEEFAFRVLFQGWLETIVSRLAPQSPASIESDLAETSVGVSENISSDEPSAELAAVEAPESVSTFRVEPEPAEPKIIRSPGWAPILITATCFALAHLGNGPSAVPLFFFGLALGYVYRQTHRILPSLVLHMSLNGFTMLIVVAQLLGKQ
jgi:membrane protease YdiL (CAAX protease family)